MTETDPGQIEAVRAVARLSRVLERASGELSLPHYRVLAAIAAGEERASRLAARLAVGKPAVSAAVESLAGRGLVTRASVASDQRAASLHLTPEGEAVLARVEAEMTARLARLVEPSDEADAIYRALVSLGGLLDADQAARARSREAGR